jgi:endonuclease I
MKSSISKMLILLLWPFLSIVAQIHPYYSEINQDSRSEELKAQLQALITSTHINLTIYTPGVWNALKVSDLESPESDQILLIYGFSNSDDIASSDRLRHVDLSCHTSSCIGLWVREHVYPRSLGTPNLGSIGAGSDLHALHAIDDNRNNLRGNRPFGFGSGNSTVVSGGAFYPGDEWKGDVARMMMYMHLRYPEQCPAERVGVGGATFSVIDEMPDIFLIWNAQDPPSEHEKVRNELFYTLQGNRNPFIDNPALATQIWNGPQAIDTWASTSTRNRDSTMPLIIYPNISSEFLCFSPPLPSSSHYSIIDLNSTRVQKGQTNNNQIDIRFLTNGMYLLCLETEYKPIVFKFIKQ